jgi:hypothetical protein
MGDNGLPILQGDAICCALTTGGVLILVSQREATLLLTTQSLLRFEVVTGNMPYHFM